MTFMGVEMRLRQIWADRDTPEIRFFNEELLEDQWTPVDNIICRRV